MTEIKPNEVYTTSEAQTLLKISNSTIKRHLKRGLINANNVGGQYKILGKLGNDEQVFMRDLYF